MNPAARRAKDEGMTAKTWFQTTAIDYPNSRPHIGTAFEKIGADVQARYRRMEGYDVFFLMGNDENTVKVAKRAAELGQDAQAYCDDMARQFREVWDALDISYDDFIQTSERAAQAVLPEVHPEGVRQRPHLQGRATRAGTATAARRSRPRRSTTRTTASARTTRRRSSRRSGAVLLLRAVGVPGPAAEVLRGEPRLHPAGEPAQ